MEKMVIPETPYEEFITKICGEEWRSFSKEEVDGAIGVAIVKSVLDGIAPELNELSSHLGVPKYQLRAAYYALSMNGVFLRDRIHNDKKALESGKAYPWCYYAGYASSLTGPWRKRNGRFSKRSSK